MLRLQAIHDYVHWHCSINYSVKLILIRKENLCKNRFLFQTEMISA